MKVLIKVGAAAAALALSVLPSPAQLRWALAAALKGGFGIVRVEPVRRSTRHGGGAYWLAHVRPRRAGSFSLRYTYRYEDPVNKQDPLYTHVERTIAFNVGPRGYSDRFASRSGNSLLTTPVIMQPGERLTLKYLGFSRRGRGVEDKPDVVELEARARRSITRLPFRVNAAEDFNEWIVQRLPR